MHLNRAGERGFNLPFVLFEFSDPTTKALVLLVAVDDSRFQTGHVLLSAGTTRLGGHLVADLAPHRPNGALLGPSEGKAAGHPLAHLNQ